MGNKQKTPEPTPDPTPDPITPEYVMAVIEGIARVVATEQKYGDIGNIHRRISVELSNYRPEFQEAFDAAMKKNEQNGC